jgi:hypothetical protein
MIKISHENVSTSYGKNKINRYCQLALNLYLTSLKKHKMIESWSWKMLSGYWTIEYNCWTWEASSTWLCSRYNITQYNLSIIFGRSVVLSRTPVSSCEISAYIHLNCDFEPCSWRGVLDTTLCNSLSVIATGRWFSPGIPVFSTNKTDIIR